MNQKTEESSIDENVEVTTEMENGKENVNEVNMPIGREKSPTHTGLIVILVLLLVAAVGGVMAYKYFTTNPTDIVKMVLNRAYDDFSKSLKELDNSGSEIDFLNEGIKVTGDLKFVDDKYKDMDKESINFDLGLDYKNKMAEVGVGLLKDNLTLADISMYYQNDMAYLKSDTMFDNVYNQGEYKFNELFNFTELEDLLSGEPIDTDDIDFVVREFKDALLNSLDEKAMSLSKGDLTVGGKNIKVDKITYNIDKETFRDLKKALAQNVLDNEKLVDKLAKMTGIEEKDIRDSFEELKKDSSEDDITGEFAIYTTGLQHKLVKVELADDEGTLYLTEFDKTTEIVYDDGTDSFSLIIREENDANVVEANMSDDKIAEFVIRSDNDSVDVDYEISFPGVEAQGSLKITYDEKNKKKMNAEIEFNIDGSIDSQSFNYDIELRYTVEGGVTLDKIDSKSALTDFTESDSEKMLDKLEGLEDSQIFSYFSQGFMSDGGFGDF